MRIDILALVAVLCFVGTGCFKSSTSQASSDSSSDSSSSCSKGDDSKLAFERDVRQLTVAYVVSGGDIGAFQRDLAAAAEAYGMTDWERSDDTYRAIGRGLAEAGVDKARTDAFARALSGASKSTQARIAAGYAPVTR